MNLPLDNKVAQSGLISIDIAGFINSNDILMFDIKPFLFMELILKEKDFRAAISTFDFSIFSKKVVGIFCSVDAIIPMWANMLLASAVHPFAKAV